MGANDIEKFTIEVVNRGKIHGADYNPRQISESAKKKLKKFLKDKGLYAPIIINRLTMNIVSGHQRIEAMDSIIRKPDYDLTVAMVELEEQEEIEANIFMNNPGAMGEWDLNLLGSIRETFPEIDFEKTLGFDLSDLTIMFPDVRMAPAAAVARKEVEAQSEELTVDNFRELKKEQREKAKQENEENGSYHISENDYAVTFVFPNNREKRDFMARIGKQPTDKMLKSSILFDLSVGKFNLSSVGHD